MIQLCFIFLIILFSTQFSSFQEKLFPGQINIYILLIGLLQWINYISSVTIQFGESKAENIFVQKINFISSTLATSINVSLYIFDYLTLNTFIISNYVGSLFIIVVNSYYFLIVMKNDYFDSFNFDDLKPILNYYVEYCKPLVVYGIFGFFSNFFDRWFLQHSDGSIEQGFFLFHLNGYQ